MNLLPLIANLESKQPEKSIVIIQESYVFTPKEYNAIMLQLNSYAKQQAIKENLELMKAIHY